MARKRWMIATTLALTATLAACSSGGTNAPDAPSATTLVTSSSGEEPTTMATDPLVGTWTTVITQQLQNKAAKAAGLELGSSEEQFGAAGPVTIEITFDGGHLTEVTKAQGLPADVGWAGPYQVVDDDTIIAGDDGDLYLEYTFAIEGNQLILDMVKDDYPAFSEAELAGEVYAQTVIYESAPFTRVS